LFELPTCGMIASGAETAHQRLCAGSAADTRLREKEEARAFLLRRFRLPATRAARGQPTARKAVQQETVMANSPYLDLPVVSLAVALKAGVQTLCATPVPKPSDGSASPLALPKTDQVPADFAAITNELNFIKRQLPRQPDRAWLSRMGLIGFGSVGALLGAPALLLAR